MSYTNKILNQSFLYHIYPLGACGAPMNHTQQDSITPRLSLLTTYLEHLKDLGVNMIYLGPVFESDSHGYDTRSYYHVDARLGTNQTLKDFSSELHAHGMRLILDGVFNHVGRGFWAFQDVLLHGASSAYKDWFLGLDFSHHSSLGDPFTYQGWEGHLSLVKLNLNNKDLRKHLLDAVLFWIDEFGIDGLRLDAADCVQDDFWRFLRKEISAQNPNFVFLGEIIHGDYQKYANPEMFHTTTNYAAYKGLWSSLNDANYFEIAYTLNQQFGPNGAYAHLPMYNFVDNHDVNRIASQIDFSAHLFPLYGMLFTIPGFPSIYYGSEFGFQGERSEISDAALRPSFDLKIAINANQNPALTDAIRTFAKIRKNSSALQFGDYKEEFLTHQQFAFSRTSSDQKIYILFNAADESAQLSLNNVSDGLLIDLLNQGDEFLVNGTASIQVPPNWLRILKVQS